MSGVLEQLLAAQLRTNELLEQISGMSPTQTASSVSTAVQPQTETTPPVTASNAAVDKAGVPVPDEAAGKVDKSGRPWDSRIDSSNGKMVASTGLWQKKRGLADMTRNEVIAKDYPEATAQQDTPPPVTATPATTPPVPAAEAEPPVEKIDYVEGIQYTPEMLEQISKWHLENHGLESLKLICTRMLGAPNVQEVVAKPELHALFHQWCVYDTVTEEFCKSQGR